LTATPTCTIPRVADMRFQAAEIRSAKSSRPSTARSTPAKWGASIVTHRHNAPRHAAAIGSSCLGHSWKREVGKFSRAPKASGPADRALAVGHAAGTGQYPEYGPPASPPSSTRKKSPRGGAGRNKRHVACPDPVDRARDRHVRHRDVLPAVRIDYFPQKKRHWLSFSCSAPPKTLFGNPIWRYASLCGSVFVVYRLS
jgi:hypothetical protein